VATIVLNGRTYVVDEEGFLDDPEIWNEQVAADLATTEDIATLSADQWKLVNYIHNYYIEFRTAPMIRKLCKDNGFKLNQVYEMFPSGPAKGACKVAGLPKPTGCV
jgi:tRNA 2-thiouridine synthesizing protein E